MEFEVSIILSTINEIENLPRIVEKIENVAKFNYQFIFVDDGSTDGTRDFILNYFKTHKNAKYIFNDSKRSTLIAHYQGTKSADGKFIIIMDSDMQHPPEKINDIFEKLKKGYDIVVASRYIKEGSPGNRKPLRGLISRVAGAMAKTYIKNARKTTDPLSGFFGFKSGLKLNINEKWRGYKILLFLIASNPNVKIIDIPYKFQERKKGESKVAKGFSFIRLYITELILVKKTEIKSLKLNHKKL